MSELNRYNIKSQEDLESWIQNYLDYLFAEGIAGKHINGNYYLKTEKQLKEELERIK